MADTAFRPDLGEPAYPEGQGPRILLDEAHNNFHTVEGRYQTAVRVLRHDGFVVEPNRVPFTPEALAGVDLLLIANALSDRNVQDWSLPTPSAFTPEEVQVVRAWVEGGGRLLLIADHMPFPGCAADLAAAFGVEFLNGFATDAAGSVDTFMFRRAEGTLLPHPVTDGRTASERVDSVISLTGQAFPVPPPFEPILLIPDGGIVLLPERAWEFSPETEYVSGETLSQGAVGEWGEGRVAFWGEAAMFSAQVSGEERRPMGMNLPEANQNPQLLLNLVRWLTER